MDKLSYALGMVIANNLRGLGVTEVSTDDFGRAVNAVLGGKPTELDVATAQAEVQQLVRKRQEQVGQQQREAGQKFLEENALRAEVVVTDSGLQYEELENQGQGRKPVITDRVKCHYEGRLVDGTVFDSSYRRGEPATFPLDGVIIGWRQGLQLMRAGDKFRFFIPHNLAYGENGAGPNIPPCATLIFDVELIEIL